MKLQDGLRVAPMELGNRMQVCVSICLLPQMTSHLCLLILSGLAVSSQFGESIYSFVFIEFGHEIKSKEGLLVNKNATKFKKWQIFFIKMLKCGSIVLK